MREILKGEEANNFISPVIEGDEGVKTNIELLLRNNQIQIPHFIEVSDDEIYVNLELINFREEIIAFFDEIFREHYFEELDYKIFNEIIFNFDRLKSNNENKRVKIAKSIVSFEKNRREKYQRPNINGNKSAQYTFSKLYEEINNGGKLVEAEVKLNIDEFIAAMWNFGIKHGLKIEEIQKAFNEDQISRITIAEFTDYVPGIDARFLSLVKLGVDHQLKRTKNGNFDLQEYERVFPQIQENTRIYQKIEKVPGQNGMDILGRPIIAPQVKDKNIYELIEGIDSGLKVENDGGIDFIVAEKDGYIIPLQGYYDSKKYGEDEGKIVEIKISDIVNKLKLTSELTLGVVGPDTGRINTFGKVISKGVVSTYSITCGEAEIGGEVSGCIYAKNDIKIKGNVSGGKHTRTGKNGAITIIDGQVISEERNITIEGNVLSKSQIKALKGNIVVKKIKKSTSKNQNEDEKEEEPTTIEESTIIGKNIRVKDARNSIFIGDNIVVEGKCIDCIFITTNTLNVQILGNNGKNNNIVFVFNPNIELDKINNEYDKKINDIDKKIKEILEIIEKRTTENKEILDDIKFKGYEAFKEQFEGNNDSISEKIKKLLIENKKWYESQIEKLSKNNDEIAQLNIKLKELRIKIGELKELRIKIGELTDAKSNIISPKVIIGKNESEIRIFKLNFNGISSISDLSDEDVRKLLDTKNFLTKKHFDYDFVKMLSQGIINWQLNS